MPRRVFIITMLAVHVVFFLSAGLRAQTPVTETVAAVVNGREITVGHMILAASALPPQYRQLPTDRLYELVLEQLIQQEVLAQKHSGEVSPRGRMAMENHKRALLAEEALAPVTQGAASESGIHRIYDEEFATLADTPEYNASHILVETKGEAQAMVAQLEKGADFATLARENSTGPSGPNGGSLGWFEKGMMVPEFEAAVVALEPGRISGPVKTRFGWHVILLNQTRLSEPPGLEDVRDRIVARLRREAVSDYMTELLSEARVDRLRVGGFDTEVLRDPDAFRK